ncbi:GNAT family N-acetyltransferase [Dokdonia sp. Hel_I_53]|uniref:GNAT family N-acetyltransferase n=1 Tax=Dokdonia sp. Hel_I_53 TaxID=1566287 RepID=UPI00119972D9|nr:GNAT family N-acetyltransferase [Dokdonia sp. Hel_I_53]TVZ52555.1 ribosomal-protein-alanine N-acetyltransferase [Dokdonia sp. Hel_I_53]
MTEEEFNIIPLEEIEAQELHNLIAKNKEFWGRYFPVTIAKTETLSKTLLFIAELALQKSKEELFLFGLRAFDTGLLIGIIYLKNIDWELKEAELAYAIDKGYKNRGWTSSAVTSVSDKAFNMGLKTLIIIAHKSNKGSVSVAKKSGYLWSRTLKNEFTPTGEEPLDMELFIRKKHLV